MVIRDRKFGTELAAAVVPADWLMGILADYPDRPQLLAGAAGAALSVEVRRNEVWLAIGGLDDLTDAVADALPPA